MKILFVANIMGHLRAFHIPYMTWFHENNWDVEAAANDEGNVQLPDFVIKHHIPVQRSPYKLDNIRAYSELKKIIEDNQYDIIHCHTPMGSVLARLAVKKGSKTKVLYTCHGFQFFKGGPIKDWMLYYPVERILAHRTDGLITINQQDFQVARRFRCQQLYYIPGVGVDLTHFYPDAAVRNNMREKLKVDEGTLMIFSAGELSKRKNHQVIVDAISKIKDQNIMYFIAGEGSLRKELEQKIYDLGLEQQVFLLGYCNNIFELCNAADVFAFPSKREGLGIAALEAMSVGVPVLTSNVGGIPDYAQNGITGFCYNANDVDGFAKGIEKLYQSKKLRKEMGQNAREVAQKFSLEHAYACMTEIYSSYM
jgi:glycosyltransferase EpsD